MFDLDLDAIEDVGGGLSVGEHVLTVTGAELKETKKPGGLYIKVEFTAANSQKHWENFNIKNSNPDAERIGKGQLKAFVKAAGFTGKNLNDVNSLLGLKVLAKIKATPDTGYGVGRAVSSYKSVAADAMAGNDPFA